MSNYGTVPGFKEYHDLRGSDYGAATDDDIQKALLVASEWIDARYVSLFDGLKVGLRSQVREWPRTGALDYYGYVIDQTSVPNEVTEATYEVALIQLNDVTPLSVNFTPAKYRKVAVDGAISLEYAQFQNSDEVQTQFKRVEEILSGITTTRGQSDSRLSGSVTR